MKIKAVLFIAILLNTLAAQATCNLTLATGSGSPTQVVCWGSPIIQIKYNTNGNSIASSTLPAGLTANIIPGGGSPNLVTISGTPTASGSITVVLSGSGGCTISGSITVRSPLSGGTINDNQTICYNTAPSAFTSVTPASGGGALFTYTWQYTTTLAATPGDGSWTDIGSSDDETYTSGPLTSSTKFVRKAVDGTCTDPVYSNVVTIIVHPVLSGGTISSDQTICNGADVSAFTSGSPAIGGSSSFTYTWQYTTTLAATPGDGSWTDIGSANSPGYDHGTLTTSTKFIRKAVDATCSTPVYSNPVTVTVRPVVAGGSIGSDQNICYGSDVAAFSNEAPASGGAESFTYTWQYTTTLSATPGDANWTDIGSSNSVTYDHSILNTSTKFVRKAVDGSCSTPVYSNQVTVTVMSGGTIGGNQTICYNATPSALTGSTAASGGDGTFTYTWQYTTTLSATPGDGSWIDIGSSDNESYTSGTLTSSTKFVRKAEDGVCGVPAYSNAITVTVLPALSGGAISSDQTICNGADVAAFTSGAPAGGGSGSFTYTWQYTTTLTATPGDGSWTDIGSANSPGYDHGTLTTSTKFIRKAVDATCSAPVYSNPVTITVRPVVAGGSIGSDQNICYGSDVAAFTSGAPASGGAESFTYTWQYTTTLSATPGDGSWTDIGSSNAETYNHGTLDISAKFIRKAVDGSCATPVYSNQATVTVMSGGTIAADQTICYNADVPAFTNTTATGGSGSFTYKWYSTNSLTAAPGDPGWTEVGTSMEYDHGTLANTARFVRKADDGVCAAPVYSNVITITVLPVLSGGTISSDQTICNGADVSGFTSGTLASGGSNNFNYAWQYTTTLAATPGDGSWSDIGSSNSAAFDYGTLTASAKFVRKAVDAACSTPVYSNPVTITVRPALAGGSISSDQTICYGNDVSPFLDEGAASGGGGGSFTYAWQSTTILTATPGDGSWTDLPSGNSLTYDYGTLNTTTRFVRKAVESTCTTPVYSNIVTVTVRPALTGGTIGTSRTICYNTDVPALTSISAASGGAAIFTYTWQFTNSMTAVAGDGSWSDISGSNSDTYDPASLTATTRYVRKAVDASCTVPVYSNVITITVNPLLTAGSIGSSQTICYNTDAAAFTSTVNAAGGSGSYTYTWQKTTSMTAVPGDGSWSDIGSSNSAGYDFGNLSATTRFVRKVDDGSCNPIYSNVVTVTVNPLFSVGSISSNQTICYNSTPAQLNGVAPSGGDGSYSYQWQFFNGSIWQNITSATGITYQPGALASTTRYRLLQTSGSSCGSLPTNEVLITVHPVFAVGSISASQTICYGTVPSSLNGVAPTGGDGSYSYQWQYFNGSLWQDITSENNINYQPPALTATTRYRQKQISGSSCGNYLTNEVLITVNPLPVANNQTPPSLCEDTYGSGTTAHINITSLNNAITGTAPSTTVTWYRSVGSGLVATPTDETISNGEVFHPRVTNTLTSCQNDAVVTYGVTPKVNLGSVTISGVPRLGAVLTVNYSTAGMCLPENAAETQIEWYRSATPGGSGTRVSLVSGETKTYTLTGTVSPAAGDYGKYLRVQVSVSDGTTPLLPFVSSGWTSVVQENLVPSVVPSSVSISGILQAAQTLTAHYTYNDAEGDPESGSVYSWYKACPAPGVIPADADYTVIPGETGITHVIGSNEQGCWFKFAVTPKAGTNNTLPGTLAMMIAGYGPSNKQPEAGNLNITGIQEVGQKLTGTYDYYDADGDPKGTCTFRWLKNGVAIPGATDIYYYLASSDEGALISFEVTPVATTGFPLTGIPVTSAQTGAIQPLTTDFVNFRDKYCYGEGPTDITIKNLPPTAINKSFRVTKPGAAMIYLDPLTVRVYPSQMTPIRPVGSKMDSLVFSYTDIMSGLKYRIARPFVVDSIGRSLNIASINPAYCVDATASAITVEGIYPLGGNGAWTDAGNLLSDKVTTGASQGATINPNRGTAGSTYTINYQYTSPKGCLSPVITKEVKINPLPNPDFPLSAVVNYDGGPVTLTPVQPGGTFSGIGVSGSQFHPNIAGQGTRIITYSVTDANMCFKSLSKSTEVKIAEGTISGLSSTLCFGNINKYVSVSGLPAGAVPDRFSNKNSTIQFTPGASDAIYSITAAGTGNDIVKFFYKLEGTEFWLTYPLLIDDPPKAVIDNLYPGEKVCQTTAAYQLKPDIKDGTFSGPVIGNYLDPAKALGNAVVSYTYTDATGCQATTDIPIYIIKKPEVSFDPSGVCISQGGESITFTNNTVSEDAVSEWLWEFSETGAAPVKTKDASYFYRTDGIHSLSLKVITVNGCEATKSSAIDLGIRPVASFYWKNDCYAPGAKIRLYDAVTSVSPITSRKWVFNGMENTIDPQPEFALGGTGYATAKYIVMNSYGCKDSLTRSVYVRKTYTISGDNIYSENFEAGQGGWIRDDSVSTANSWTFGTPDRQIMHNAASGTNAWFTRYNLLNPGKEASAVISPCFDFTDVDRPMISLKAFRRFERNRNGAALQYKLDGSKEWKYVGTIGDGINWYNSTVISGSPGGDKMGWTTMNNDPDTAWVEARHKLDELRGKKNVKFRLSYGSDDVIAPEEGMAFDDVWIGERTRNVLLEHFTNNSSRDGSNATAIVNSVASKASRDIINIQYHTNFPGADQYYDQNPGEVNARVLYYGLTRIPYAFLEGGNNSAEWAKLIDFRTTPLDTNDVARRSLLNPQFSIDLNSSATDGILTVGCRIKAEENVSCNNLAMFLVVTENKNTQFIGANNETSFFNVFRKFIPDAGGIRLKASWASGEELSVPDQTWVIRNIANFADIKVIAIIQNTLTKEVYQAASVQNSGVSVEVPETVNDGKFEIYPNPAKDKITIRFGTQLLYQADIRIYTYSGELVRTYRAGAGSKEFSITDPGLKGGMYLVRVTSGFFDLGNRKLVISGE